MYHPMQKSRFLKNLLPNPPQIYLAAAVSSDKLTSILEERTSASLLLRLEYLIATASEPEECLDVLPAGGAIQPLMKYRRRAEGREAVKDDEGVLGVGGQ
ncbi:hypothetical protein E2562_020584 [Oryza meyeriana var. granulata]|uniref:Uncharacterized protein n=1 Tax=Oryza meyeriana var. granulata TaxID=110450 RepID=A0A6G1DXZ6_9ORYZ|nr:hypothetical protein E2562_020584 [Oryza meyeriana var. granulata]